jgi:hypothetical protein
MKNMKNNKPSYRHRAKGLNSYKILNYLADFIMAFAIVFVIVAVIYLITL